MGGLIWARGMRWLMGWAFNLLYHGLAWTYDAVAALVSGGRWHAWVLRAAAYVPPGRVLELGFGPGHLLTDLSGRGVWCCGLDESMPMARQARRNLHRRGLPARLIRGLGQALPFADGCFDAVVATFPAPYLFEALTLAELRRVLAADGRVVLLPLTRITGGGLLDRALALLFRVTGQSPPAQAGMPSALLAHITTAGFMLETRVESLRGSDVYILLLTPAKN